MIELLFLINAVRATPLVEDPALSYRAEVRAEQLCDIGQWSHANAWLSFAGTDYKYLGENLARNFKTDKEAHEALMKSPTHMANIVKPQYTHVGIGKADCGITVELFGGI